MIFLYIVLVNICEHLCYIVLVNFFFCVGGGVGGVKHFYSEREAFEACLGLYDFSSLMQFVQLWRKFVHKELMRLECTDIFETA